MSDRVVVRSASVEAAKVLSRRNAARGRVSDPATLRLAEAKLVSPEPGDPETNGSGPHS